MIFISRDWKVEIPNADGEWVETGIARPMEKPEEEIKQAVESINLQLKGCRITNAIVDEFWKPPVVRQTEPFWVKKWRRNR